MGVNMETARFFKQDFEVKYLLLKLVVYNAVLKLNNSNTIFQNI